MIHWLDIHSGGVQAVATVILVIVTGFYAWLTRSISRSSATGVQAARDSAGAAQASADSARAGVEEMQQQRRDNVRPVVVLHDVKFRRISEHSLESYQLEATARNIGLFVAFDISVTLNDDEFVDHGRVSYLTTNDSASISVKTKSGVTERGFKGDHEMNVTYFDVHDNCYETKYVGSVQASGAGPLLHVRLNQPRFRFVGLSRSSTV